MLPMAEEKPTRRIWSGIGCAAVLAILVAFFVYARWPDPERDLVRQREYLASWLTEQGAILTPADLSKPGDAKIQISAHRQRLGDKPIRAVTLPYGYPEYVTSRAKALFPEVVEWSVLPAETALVRLLGDAKAIEVVRNPDRVEVQRLTGEEVSHGVDEPSLADFPPKGDVVKVPPQIAAIISANLLNPELYTWGRLPNCVPHYGVRLTYFRGAERVDVLLCFECGSLETFWNQRSVTGQDFSHTYNLFGDAMKELFPKDAEIQAIKRRDRGGASLKESL